MAQIVKGCIFYPCHLKAIVLGESGGRLAFPRLLLHRRSLRRSLLFSLVTGNQPLNPYQLKHPGCTAYQPQQDRSEGKFRYQQNSPNHYPHHQHHPTDSMQRFSQFGGMLIRGENHVLFHSATSSMQLHRSHSPVCAACTNNTLHLVLYIRRFFCYKGFPFFHSESLSFFTIQTGVRSYFALHAHFSKEIEMLPSS